MDFGFLDIMNPAPWLTAARVMGILTAAYLAILWVGLVVWTHNDVRARTLDASTQALSVGAVALMFIPGLLLYILLRPRELLADAYSRRLETEAFVHEVEKQPRCGACRRLVDADFALCPYCKTALRTACESCSKPLSDKWVACPYCMADRPAQAPRVAYAPGRPAGSPRPAIQPLRGSTAAGR
jgi:hypothetical protein